MHEALGLAWYLAEHLQRARVQDDGAMYYITITDTAGNVAEVHYDLERRQWTMEEGFDKPRLMLRLRITDEVKGL